MEEVVFDTAIRGTSLQNLGVGIEGLAFGLSQQIRVTKSRAGEAAREECGTRQNKTTTQTHKSPKPTSVKSLENKDTNQSSPRYPTCIFHRAKGRLRQSNLGCRNLSLEAFPRGSLSLRKDPIRGWIKSVRASSHRVAVRGF